MIKGSLQATLRSASIIFGITAIFIEFTSYAVLKIGIVKDVFRSNGVVNPDHLRFQGYDWRNEKEEWGAWHIPNSTARHVRSCFDVNYKANNAGARDNVEYDSSLPKNSILLLGDSFAEGYGVSHGETLAEKLKEITGRKVLNFGTSNNFGPVQYYLVYQKLAKQYPHSSMVILFLPSNDFVDNDPSLIDLYKDRHRPYFRQTGSSKFEYFHPTNSVKRERFLSNANPYPQEDILRERIRYWLTYSNTVRLMRSVRIIKSNPAREGGWFRATPIQAKASMFYLSKLISEAKSSGVSDIVIFAIPSQADIDFKRKTNSDPNSQGWVKSLEQLSDTDRSLTFVSGFDLLPKDVSRQKSLFLKCDGHWSANGNKWSADIIAKYLNKPSQY